MMYRERPEPSPAVGPCSTCRFRLGDYCVEDGTVLAPGQCERYRPTPTFADILGGIRERLTRSVGP